MDEPTKNKKRWRYGLMIVLLASLVVGGVVSAVGGELATGQRMAILMKVLSYDRQLPARQNNGKILIAVVFNPSSGASSSEKDRVLKAVAKMSKIKLNGLAITAKPVSYSSQGSLRSFVGKNKTAAIYVSKGLDGDVKAIANVANATNVATLTGQASWVNAGLAIGAVASGGKGQILVNLTAAKKANLKLDSSVLRLAKVVR